MPISLGEFASQAYGSSALYEPANASERETDLSERGMDVDGTGGHLDLGPMGLVQVLHRSPLSSTTMPQPDDTSGRGISLSIAAALKFRNEI